MSHDTAYLGTNAYHDMCAIANAKANGTQEDIDTTIRQYGEDVTELNDVL